MPNHVTNKIIINGMTLRDQKRLVGNVSADDWEGNNNDRIDFNKLIPTPLHIYTGNVSMDDQLDFGEHNTWTEWNRKNWGTKWNAYETIIAYGDPLIIRFDTAWSVPYPFIIAFSKYAEVKFELKYYDEGACFWGIETWENGERLSSDKKNEDNKNALCIELKGYNPDEEEDE